MKKKVFLVVMCLSVLVACNNEDFEQLQMQSSTMTKDIIELQKTDIIDITKEVWRDIMSSKGEFIEYENPLNLNRMTIENKSVYGYTSCSAREGKSNLKARFSQSACNIMGIPYGVYIVDFCEAKIKINLATGEQFLYVDESPNCGFKPDMESTRGYAMSMTSNVVILTTYLTHIKYDALGRNVNKWWPVTPNDLVWDYKILLPNAK